MAAKAAVKKNLSAIKRVRQAEKKNLSNRMARTRLKSVTKAVETAIKGNNREDSEKTLKIAIKTISSANSKGILHKNNSARKISKLTKKVNTLSKAETG